MTTHALLKPVTVAPNGVHWSTLCGLRVLMPKQRFSAGAQVNVADGKAATCPACFAEEERRSPEQIEAEQRRQEEAGVLAVTFDESVGEIESDDGISDAEDDQLISEENEEYPR
jgi:hypothetical protein